MNRLPHYDHRAGSLCGHPEFDARGAVSTMTSEATPYRATPSPRAGVAALVARRALIR